jgi:hypothetical protein
MLAEVIESQYCLQYRCYLSSRYDPSKLSDEVQSMDANFYLTAVKLSDMRKFKICRWDPKGVRHQEEMAD